MKAATKQRLALRAVKIENCTGNDAKIELLLKYGVLAPSTHNTQPWKLKIGDDCVDVFADFTKKIPEADPTGRDMYMSLGALIKNIEVAAGAFGVKAETTTSENLGSKEYIATIHFTALATAKTPSDSPMLDALIYRQNYRGFFKPSTNTNELGRIAKESASSSARLDVFFDSVSIEKLAKLTAEGLMLGYARPAFRKEISTYIHYNLSRKQYGLHGHSLRMNLPQSLVIPKIMRRKDIGPKLADLNFKSFITTSGVAVLSSKDDEAGWLEAGRVLEELNLRLTAAGYTSSIFAAAIEMGKLRKQLAKLVGSPTKYAPQLVICIGTPKSLLPYSARKKLAAVLIR